MSNVIINVPYSSSEAPPAVATRLGLSPQEWNVETWRLTDPHLLALARKAALVKKRSLKIERPVVAYPYSPVVADPWGFWAYELGRTKLSGGQAAILPQTTAGRPISWSDKDSQTIMSRTVEPFYEQLQELITQALVEHNLVLLVTLRSFTPVPLSFEDQKRPRPQVCVTTNEKRTPNGLAKLLGHTFRAYRWWAELNWPHASGGPLPPSLAEHPRVRSVGLSLNRSLYMDEKTGEATGGAIKTARALGTILNILSQELDHVAKKRLVRAQPPKRKSSIIKAADFEGL